MLQLYTGLQTWWAELKERASEERGATAVEYALMVALIAVVIILAVTFLGQSARTSSRRSATQSPAPSPIVRAASSAARDAASGRRREGPTAPFGVDGT